MSPDVVKALGLFVVFPVCVCGLLGWLAYLGLQGMNEED